jgi:hypothetical protein
MPAPEDRQQHVSTTAAESTKYVECELYDGVDRLVLKELLIAASCRGQRDPSAGLKMPSGQASGLPTGWRAYTDHLSCVDG